MFKKKRKGSILIFFIAIIPMFAVMLGLCWDVGYFVVIKMDIAHTAKVLSYAACGDSFDKEHFRNTGEKKIKWDTVTSSAANYLNDNQPEFLKIKYEIVSITPTPDDPGGVITTLKADVRMTFLTVIPGFPKSIPIIATERGTLKRKML